MGAGGTGTIERVITPAVARRLAVVQQRLAGPRPRAGARSNTAAAVGQGCAKVKVHW